MTKQEIEKRAQNYAKLFKKHKITPDRIDNGSFDNGCGCLLAVIAKERKTTYFELTDKYFTILEEGFVFGYNTKHWRKKSPLFQIGKRVAQLVGLDK